MLGNDDQKTPEPDPNEITRTFKISSMNSCADNCSCCQKTLEGIEELFGNMNISRAEVYLPSKTLTIRANPRAVPDSAILAAIDEVGHEAQIVKNKRQMRDEPVVNEPGPVNYNKKLRNLN